MPSYPSGQAQKNFSWSSRHTPRTHGDESQGWSKGVGVDAGVVGAIDGGWLVNSIE